MMNKKALEMSFVWIFAIAVGAIIVIFAIYFATNLVRTGYNEINTKTARELVNILDPLQTTLEDGKTQAIELIDDTRIYNSCENIGDFGYNKIEISEKNKFGDDKWTNPGGDIRTESQYLFSQEIVEGKRIYFFIKSMKIPFKTADIMMMYSENYCFVNPPENMKSEIEGLTNENNSNIVVMGNLIDCGKDSIKVCFISNKECDVIVSGNCNDINCENVYDSGTITKDGESVTYINSLIYAGIFSSKDNYECNIKRIMKRTNKLTNLYIEKSKFVSGKGCGTNLQQELSLLSEASSKLDNSRDLSVIKILSDDINEKNMGVCRLF
ncbi:MAG: hypothetical protein AABX03_04440 [Nanoarchaeota archaeon]